MTPSRIAGLPVTLPTRTRIAELCPAPVPLIARLACNALVEPLLVENTLPTGVARISGEIELCNPGGNPAAVCALRNGMTEAVGRLNARTVGEVDVAL